MQRMSALDAGFLHLEDQHVALHIAAIAVFEGPVPEATEVNERFARMIDAFPHHRQRLRRSRLDLRRPGWTDVEHVDLGYHIRWAALPAPGTPSQLERLVGRLMTYRLDLDRPPWEAWVIEGLQDDRWALVLKVHHSVVDGVGGMAMFHELFDAADGTTLPRPALPQHRRPSAFGAAADLLRGLTPALSSAAASAATAHTISQIVSTGRKLKPNRRSSLSGELGTPRRYRALTIEMSDVRLVRDALGGTVNDVVLAMVTRGFRDLLVERGEPAEPETVRCLVPVSVRADDEARAGANKITFLLLDLPIEIADAAVSYATLHDRVGRLKRSGAAGALGEGFAVANLLPSPLVAGAVRLLRHVPQRIITTVATNVPGPRRPQTFLGRPLLALYPYVPIGDRIRIGVAVTSYLDRLHFGITCDRDSVRDADVFVAAMATGLTDLVKRVESLG